jgi:hypothetical protein
MEENRRFDLGRYVAVTNAPRFWVAPLRMFRLFPREVLGAPLYSSLELAEVFASHDPVARHGVFTEAVEQQWPLVFDLF